MLTYKQPNPFTGKANIACYVYLDGKKVGKIEHVLSAKGYQYIPMGQKDGGEVFNTLEECKKSLHNDY